MLGAWLGVCPGFVWLSLARSLPPSRPLGHVAFERLRPRACLGRRVPARWAEREGGAGWGTFSEEAATSCSACPAGKPWPATTLFHAGCAAASCPPCRSLPCSLPGTTCCLPWLCVVVARSLPPSRPLGHVAFERPAGKHLLLLFPPSASSTVNASSSSFVCFMRADDPCLCSRMFSRGHIRLRGLMCMFTLTLHLQCDES